MYRADLGVLRPATTVRAATPYCPWPLGSLSGTAATTLGESRRAPARNDFLVAGAAAETDIDVVAAEDEVVV